MSQQVSQNMFISAEIFELFPGYCRGVVVVTEIENGSAPEWLTQQIRSEETRLRQEYAGVDLNEVARLESWREAFRVMGIKPTKHRPSIDGLTRRVLQGNPIPSINTLVDIGNLFSLQHLVPIGGHAIDVLTEGMALRRADGSETFTAFGSDVEEHPDPGEIIFVDGNQVMTRRWVWRQAVHSLVRTETRAVEINVDGLPPVTYADVENICEHLADIVVRCCGGKARRDILTINHPSMVLF